MKDHTICHQEIIYNLFIKNLLAFFLNSHLQIVMQSQVQSNHDPQLVGCCQNGDMKISIEMNIENVLKIFSKTEKANGAQCYKLKKKIKKNFLNKIYSAILFRYIVFDTIKVIGQLLYIAQVSDVAPLVYCSLSKICTL